jgi:hypothetical protein
MTDRSQFASGLSIARFARGFLTFCGIACMAIAAAVTADGLSDGDVTTASVAAGMIVVGIVFTLVTRRVTTGFIEALRGELEPDAFQRGSEPEFAPLEGVVDGVFYHADSLSYGNVEVWIDLLQDRMRRPPLFVETRSGLSDPASAEWGAEQIQALIGLGATNVDVGFHSDSLQVTFPWDRDVMTRELIERAVQLMAALRRQALE